MIYLSICKNHNDEIHEKEFYTLTNCKLKFFYGKKLATTEDTQITVTEKHVLPPADSTPVPHNVISNPEILNIGVNIYAVCNNKDCKKKVTTNPGSKLLKCHSCNKTILKNCYVEMNATFQLEKDNKNITATAFAKVVSSYLGKDVYVYKDHVDELTEQLLFIENVIFHRSNSGKLITQITPINNADNTTTLTATPSSSDNVPEDLFIS